METKTFIVANYSELEDIIFDYYGKSYHIPSGEEWTNNASYQLTVEKGKLDNMELEEMHRFRNGETDNWILDSIMKDLVNNDVLQPGQYLIEVW